MIAPNRQGVPGALPAAREMRSLVCMEGRPAAIADFEAAVVAFFVDAAALLGVPRSVAAIYGICFASPTPLCFADIVARLRLSKGSISQGLRLLREVGALEPITQPGDRCERFSPDIELRKIIVRWIEERLEKQLFAGHRDLLSLARTVPGGGGQAERTLRRRINSLQNWHDKGRAIVPAIKGVLRIS